MTQSRDKRVTLTRREATATIAGMPLLLSGCGSWTRRLPPNGRIVGAAEELGHRLRTPTALPAPSGTVKQCRVAIVGGGVAGLTAAWRLQREGMDDYLLLELESAVGGTARSGSSPLANYPWGAHYLPAPFQENRALLTLLDEMEVIERWPADGEPVIRETVLCRAPQERLFFHGRWHEGLYPYQDASDNDLSQLKAFESEIERWVEWRDASGKRAFCIPTAQCSRDLEATQLDSLSMDQWMQSKGLTSQRLRWMVDYACRDDYGLRPDQTSAWAGLFYFAARVRTAGETSQPFMTWPEGNGRLVRHLRDKSATRIQTGRAAVRIETSPDGKHVGVTTLSAGGEVELIQAERVIFAAPQFLAPHVFVDFPETRRRCSKAFQYTPWLVANLFLSDRPKSEGFPLSWDNVLYDSPSLGYVVATHQLGIDHGPTILTYYLALCDGDPARRRQELLQNDWEYWANVILDDLEKAHPEIRSLTEQLDVMRWGHAMIRPTPGFIWGGARETAAQPWRNVHFANTDLSGVPLFEEAFWRGIRTAEEAAAELGLPCDTMLS